MIKIRVLLPVAFGGRAVVAGFLLRLARLVSPFEIEISDPESEAAA